MNNTLNLNIAECLRRTSDFGSTIVHNTCLGSSYVVPWGGVDWVSFWALSLLACAGVAVVIGIAVMCGVFVAVIIKDTWG